ncbi:hypothetical protein PWT90_09265 [Aphanocladium album]|nr:hypothetical protein PWT90_09265 [Aphanocladium album]
MDDSSFGPRLLGHFDFTLLFEHTIFQIGPSVLIIFTTPYYVYRILRGTSVVRSGPLLYAKLACAVTLIAVQLANLVLWSTSSVSGLDTDATRAAATLSFISALCIAAMVYSCHGFFLHASVVLGLILTVTLPLDIVTTMTYYHRAGLEQIARLSVAVPVLKLIILLLEELSKRSLIRKDEVRKSLGSEGVAGFWNKSLFIWLNPLLLFGYRNTITRSHLPSLAPQLAAETLFQRFWKHWDKRQNKTSKFALAICCMAACPWSFLSILLPRTLVIGFSFSQPFLLQDVVDEIQTDTPSADVQNGLMVATALIYVGIAVSRSWYAYIKNQLTVAVRAMLISAIYHKTLRLRAEELKKSAAITLVNTDLKAVEQLVNLSYEACASVVEVALGLAMLAKFVGTAAIFALIPTLITALIASFLTKRAVAARLNWNGHITRRIESTSNVLAQSKEIKMLGLGPYIAKHLQELFEEETHATMKDRNLLVVSLTLAACADSITPVLVIAGTLFWTRASETLTSSQFFATLAFVKLVSGPLGVFLEFLPYWATGFASLRRVQEYLALPERVDTRTIVPGFDTLRLEYSAPTAPANVHSSSSETHSLGNPLVDASSASGNERLKSQVSSTAVTTSFSEKSGIHETIAAPANSLEMVDVSITTDSGEFILQNVSLQIAIGKLAMVVGPVGCGKSTFLRAILGEMKPNAGQVKVAGEIIAYCSQKPWIRNTTLQNNVTWESVYNAARYEKVIYTCALDVDFAQLPDGDQSIAGTDGCNLSGGQRARISLARALYLEGDMLLLDDVLSALDNDTSATVRSRLFASDGEVSERPRTVIMVTSTTEHLKDADVIYSMNQSGHLAETTQSYRNPSPSSVHESRDGDSKGDAAEGIELPVVKPASNKEDIDDKVDTRKGDFSLYSYFVGPAGIPFLLLEGFLLIIASIGERMPQIFGRVWMDNDPANRLYYIGFAIFGFANPILHVLSIGQWMVPHG